MLPGAKAIHLKVHKHPVPKTQTYTNPGEIFTFPTIYVHTVICETNQPFSLDVAKKKKEVETLKRHNSNGYLCIS